MIYQHEETGQIAETNAMLTYPWFKIGGGINERESSQSITKQGVWRQVKAESGSNYDQNRVEM